MNTRFDANDWERASVAQLYKEYRNVLWQQRLSMRPAAIQLFDSNTHWGKWDPLTQTLFIARKLIQDHSWFYVQAILRHEMAHQLAEESHGMDAGAPHGEFFLQACARLGVPEEFKHASAQLQMTPLDWRTGKQGDASDKLLEKVQKLLALATSSNEHEALLAMEKVRELYAKYNLEQASQAKKMRFAHISICHEKKRIEAHQRRIISLLVGHFFVEVLTYKLYDAKSGEDHQAIEIIGTRENAMMAEYVYHFLLQQSEFWVRETVKAAKRAISRIERKSFRLGILEGFAEKLQQAEQGGSPRSPSSPTSRGGATALSVIGNAIMKFKKDPELRTYLSEVYPRLTRTSSSSQTLDSSAFVAGKTVGKSITLNKAVTTQAEGNRGRLLERSWRGPS